MSFRPLLDTDCGGANPLVQLGNHFTRDVAHQQEGFSHRSGAEGSFSKGPENAMVNEFLGQTAGPPQTYNMDNLLREMKTIEAHNIHQSIINGPKVINQVLAQPDLALDWSKDFEHNQYKPPQNADTIPNNYNENLPCAIIPPNVRYMPGSYSRNNVMMNRNAAFNPYINHENELFGTESSHQKVEDFFKTSEAENLGSDKWLEDFEKNKKEEADRTDSYYDKFWSKMQQDWNDLIEYDDNHPWLSQGSDLDVYKEYEYFADNPLSNIENALEKGKEFLKQGDIPTAVLCFEAAVKQEPENAEAWELLGLSQAENERDPQAIAALKKSLSLKPNNSKVLMALAVSFTNEGLQSQAINMLAKWLHLNPKYSDLVPPNLIISDDQDVTITTSLVGQHALKDMQNLFLDAVNRNIPNIDPEIQEGLGILFNISSEYDKAVDCFHVALNANPNCSKTWNRVGASLANGNRSVEAAEAYKRALEIQPGFIRARYNVGIICMNLKAYKESAEHLLTALNMQASSLSRSGLSEDIASNVSPMSETIWSTLRMVFALMGRSDLKKAANERDLNCLNHEIKLN